MSSDEPVTCELSHSMVTHSVDMWRVDVTDAGIRIEPNVRGAVCGIVGFLIVCVVLLGILAVYSTRIGVWHVVAAAVISTLAGALFVSALLAEESRGAFAIVENGTLSAPRAEFACPLTELDELRCVRGFVLGREGREEVYQVFAVSGRETACLMSCKGKRLARKFAVELASVTGVDVTWQPFGQ